MLAAYFTTAALVLYVCASGYLASRLIKQLSFTTVWLLLLTGSALIFHGIGLYHLTINPKGVDLAINKVGSLVLFSVNAIVIMSSVRKPLHSLFILLLPISAITVGLTLLHTNTSLNHLSIGIGLHILISIVSYSLLSIAVLQALLLYWQNSHLKKRQLSGLIQRLPPLQTMESLMFELVGVGVILLTGGIVLGSFYIEDMFAQHLAHKTILSIIALGIFSTLLIGRNLWGWRGNQAIRWVLVGFCILMLAYFGSKLVVEVILV
jgi:ABC-type uncharacterized transport system permease subunit